jgi:hypothetical protein
VALVEDGIVRRVRGCSRAAAADLIVDAAAHDPELVVGLDFSFSMPAWWLAACGISAPAELWGDGDRLEGWLARCEPPFWGRPGRRRPPAGDRDPLRLTERCAPGHPASVFQIGGAGAVGTASLRGMPTLHRLRAAGVAIWPFDPWRPPVAVEVWPRMAIGALVKSRPEARRSWVASQGDQLRPAAAAAALASADALDAAAAGLWLARLQDRPHDGHEWSLARADPLARLEGWIAGVAHPTAPGGRPAPGRDRSGPPVGDNGP